MEPVLRGAHADATVTARQGRLAARRRRHRARLQLAHGDECGRAFRWEGVGGFGDFSARHGF